MSLYHLTLFVISFFLPSSLSVFFFFFDVCFFTLIFVSVLFLFLFNPSFFPYFLYFYAFFPSFSVPCLSFSFFLFSFFPSLVFWVVSLQVERCWFQNAIWYFKSSKTVCFEMETLFRNRKKIVCGVKNTT